MKISGKNIFYGHEFRPLTIEFTDKIENIAEFDGDKETYNDCYIVPGFVDIHTHAAVGCDCSDGDVFGIERLTEYYAKHGVTSFCPTTMTIGEDALIDAMHSVRDAKRHKNSAKIAGINLEGPFVSKEKCGAQNPNNIHAPSMKMLHRLMEESGNLVRLVTVAPETDGAYEFIREAARLCTVSLGHTMADYNVSRDAFLCGASHVTHLFNAMPSLMHRAPGLIGAAFDSKATAELICDGHHVHPSAVRLAFSIFGDRLCLISDSLRCAYMPDGEYELGGQPIVLKNNVATLKGTQTLAGSSISLHDAVKKAVEFGVSLENAVYSASTAPSLAIKADDIGSIEKGKSADFVVLDRALNIKAVYVDGKKLEL